MSIHKEENKEEDIEFSWGYKKGVAGRNKDVQLYESFTYNGVKYSLYDCVYLWSDNEFEPDIGKLVKIWETASHKKKVKVVWFFRPIEIQNWLGDIEPLANEIFLASGEGDGLFNLNPLEAISGKCNVVCTSKDIRNFQASKEELERSDYIFSRTFDVGKCKISDQFADTIAGHEVQYFLNQKKRHKIRGHTVLGANFEDKAGFSNIPSKFQVIATGRAVKDGHSDRSINLTDKEPKTAATEFGKQGHFSHEKISCNQLRERDKVKNSNDYSPMSVSDVRPLKRIKLQNTSVDSKEDLPGHKEKSLDVKVPLSEKKGVNFHQKANTIPDKGVGQFDKDVKTRSEFLEVTRRPDADTSKWFKQQSWDERMQRAYENGSLVLLENLEPSYTSSEVEDIVWHAFNMKASAKMIPRSIFSRPHYGQAFVIFKTKDIAELVISELNKKCLMLDGGRPVVGRRGALKDPGNPSKFFGHLVIDKLRFQKQREEMRKAVSTSHYSQPNTIEYEMAIEWRAIQEKSNLWWDVLNKEQATEFENLRNQLKTRLNE